MPVRTDSNVASYSNGTLHEIALRSTIVEQSDWPLAVMKDTSEFKKEDYAYVLATGTLAFISRSIVREASLRVTYLQDLELPACNTVLSVPSIPSRIDPAGDMLLPSETVSKYNIAVI